MVHGGESQERAALCVENTAIHNATSMRTGNTLTNKPGEGPHARFREPCTLVPTGSGVGGKRPPSRPLIVEPPSKGSSLRCTASQCVAVVNKGHVIHLSTERKRTRRQCHGAVNGAHKQ